MDLPAYRRLTDQLRDGLEREPDVLGLVALGSMSGQGAPADAWSDHDFFVVVRPGSQERFRAAGDLWWLPGRGEVALAFRETAHGLKVVYRSGHLLEFAVFDPEEIALARVNRYSVLLDRADVAIRMARVAEATRAMPRPDDPWLVGQFLTQLLVGVGRWRRGERLSGEWFVRQAALGHLLRLVAAHVPADDPAAPDDLDPFRRVERAWPALAADLHSALAAELPEAARRLLSLAARVLARRVALPPEAVAAVQRAIGAGPAS